MQTRSSAHVALASVLASLLLASPLAGQPLSSIPRAERLPQDEIDHLVLPDRFENGDPRNDTGGIGGGVSDHGFAPDRKGYYHGGDLKGLIDRLDYIQGLGATAIWLTPVFRNKPVQGSGSSESSGYHGRARANGIDHFHIFGEVADDDFEPGKLAVHTRRDGYPAVLDFAFKQAALRTIAGTRGTEAWARLFDQDVLYAGEEAGAMQLPTFIGNHDQGRFGFYLRQAFPQPSEDDGGEVLVVINSSTRAISENVEVGYRSRAFTRLAGNCPAAATTPQSVRIDLPPLGYAICRATPID